MRRSLGVFVLCCAMLAIPRVGVTAAGAADPPEHSISVTGVGLGMYPSFSPVVERYGLTTTPDSNGGVTVHATTSDSAGAVLVDGREVPGGTATLTGLRDGDEISVIFEDSAGTSVHSLVYLPSGFPTMSEAVPAAPTTTDSDVLLNLGRYANDGTRNFEAVLDRRGVPRHVLALPQGVASGDLKPDGPQGHFTVSRSPTTTPGRTGNQLVELDDTFHEVGRYETQDLNQTDGHDSVLRADGSRILLADEPNSQTGKLDAVIQEVGADDNVVYTWNSADHLDPATETTTSPSSADYAHINSIQVMADGDILASFRHLSAVLKIAWHPHDGFQRGDVVWRLGGRHSDFTFVDDPYPSGPCAQHTASQLANGDILIYDDGSIRLGDDPTHCVDPSDPEGPTIARQQSRVTEYSLDEQTGTATLVWSFQVNGRFTYFAGSARRLANGNTLIGWAAERRATASEVSPQGTILWELKNDAGYLAYRVTSAVVPDKEKPAVVVTTPAPGATYALGQAVTANATCTDRGGSSLHTCTTPSVNTAVAGRHTYQVTATDGNGNATTISRTYTVAAAPFSRPDALIIAPGRPWVGNNVYGSPTQSVTQRVHRRGSKAAARVRVQAEGNRSDHVIVKGTGGSRKFAVKYYRGARDVTTQVVRGTMRLALRPGQYVDLRLVTRRLRPAKRGNSRRVVVAFRSQLDPRQRDMVAQWVRATR